MILQQNVFKSEFSVLFDAVKTKNVQFLEEKIEPIKKIFIKKSPEKNHLKIKF